MRPYLSRSFACLAALALLPAAAVRAQETASDTLLTVDHYLDWEQVNDPQLSPDGAQVIYTRRWVNKIEDKWESALWIMNADGSHNRFLVKGSDARWSPDGTRILYLADGDPKGTQLFVRWMDAEGASSQVTRVTEMPTDPRWAPGGKSISFAMLVRDSTLWNISSPSRPRERSGRPRHVWWTPCTIARTGSATCHRGSRTSSSCPRTAAPRGSSRAVTGTRGHASQDSPWPWHTTGRPTAGGSCSTACAAS